MSEMQLYEGDCLEVMDKLIAEGVVVDAVICDPPYGTTDCGWDSIIPFDVMWERLHKIVKPNGVILLFGAEPFSSALRMSNIKNFKYDWYWRKNNKTNFPNAKKQPLRDVEVASVFYKEQCAYYPQGVRKVNIMVRAKPTKDNTKRTAIYAGCNDGSLCKDHVQELAGYPSQSLHFKGENGLHPTQKPVQLIGYFVKTYTLKGETVLDFTMGSGTTGVACLPLGRNFIGIEYDPAIFKGAKKRIQHTGGGLLY